ncbi:MAG: response regulator [Pseudomonadota bacterium]
MTQPRLLLLEDDIQLLALYQKFLEAENFTVTALATFSEGMQFIDTHDTLDLAIVDFWLDETNAASVLDKLRERFPRTPTLVVSGGNDTTSIETAHAAAQVSGALAFLQKPFERQELIRVVNDLLARS